VLGLDDLDEGHLVPVVAVVYDAAEASKQDHKRYLAVQSCVQQRSGPVHVEDVWVQAILKQKL